MKHTTTMQSPEDILPASSMGHKAKRLNCRPNHALFFMHTPTVYSNRLYANYRAKSTTSKHQLKDTTHMASSPQGPK
jgi:hypothetical protein